MKTLFRSGVGVSLALSIAVTSIAATPAVAQEQDRIERAVTQPLRDTRIKDDKIPEILQLAASAPYSTRGVKTCKQIRAEVVKLETALGRDVDSASNKDGEGAAMAATAAGEVVKAILPGLGLVRVITGADKQQRRVEAAVYAGSVRRGFLKGMGLAKGCAAPAAPTKAAQAEVPELLPVKKDD
ncbi:hypothetical protein [Sphingobium algorifonticola]|uniref:Uncharacterized protein n=1 Tax=Sphingobium algorifonticola TaxID=2008318 RepID=A0A437JC70_9SPHN|nr:hypothetical protein [Sphingobium algorifonticola]RVT43518.1 hypothetical protein ENE74_02545 [Sphingobium algorifonticola]